MVRRRNGESDGRSPGHPCRIRRGVRIDRHGREGRRYVPWRASPSGSSVGSGNGAKRDGCRQRRDGVLSKWDKGPALLTVVLGGGVINAAD